MCEQTASFNPYDDHDHHLVHIRIYSLILLQLHIFAYEASTHGMVNPLLLVAWLVVQKARQS